jgi:hypothetical protein
VKETNTRAQEPKEKLHSGQKARGALEKAKPETGEMTQQFKEAAKKKTNVTIDNLGK